MRLSEFMSPELIEIGLDATDKWDAIEKMVSLLAESESVNDRNALLSAMVEREHTMTTGLGHGVAIPHALTDGVSKMVVAAATLKTPIDFESLDMQPVSIVFAIGCPMERGRDYMILLSQIARLFSNEDFRETLSRAESPEDFMNAIGSV